MILFPGLHLLYWAFSQGHSHTQGEKQREASPREAQASQPMGTFSKKPVPSSGNMEDIPCKAGRTYPLLWSVLQHRTRSEVSPSSYPNPVQVAKPQESAKVL